MTHISQTGSSGLITHINNLATFLFTINKHFEILSGSHRGKRFIVLPPLLKQQALIEHNKFVVLIEQLTFSGNSNGYIIPAKSFILSLSSLPTSASSPRD